MGIFMLVHTQILALKRIWVQRLLSAKEAVGHGRSRRLSTDEVEGTE
jgi:hypothetical protein